MFIRLLLSMAMIFAALASWPALADEEVEQKKHNRGGGLMPSICSIVIRNGPVDLFWTYRFGYPFKKVCEDCDDY